jgi:predicted DNA-binding transcriptional regulator AlpA
MGELAGVVDLEEIALRLNVKRSTVDQWRMRHRLPAPEGQLGGSPVWYWATIEEWARATGRLRAEPESVEEREEPLSSASDEDGYLF